MNIKKRIDISKCGLTNDDFVIGCASRIDPVKGITYLIEAFSDLQKKYNYKFKLIIIGEGTVKKDLEKKAALLGVSKSIIFTGYQNNISDWLDVFDVFALPSLAEYHSIGLLEAMRAGKKIVATNVGGNVESVRHLKEGIIVNSKKSKELFDEISKLYDDKNLASELAEAACRRFHNKFSEQASLDNLIEIFNSIRK